MKSLNDYIVSLLRLLALLLVVFALMIQPAIKYSSFLDNQVFELVDNNANEKENQEDESRGEDIELQLSTPYDHAKVCIDKTLVFGAKNLQSNFKPKIHIPPPEQL